METITIPKENFDALLNPARTAVVLNENFIPRSITEHPPYQPKALPHLTNLE